MNQDNRNKEKEYGPAYLGINTRNEIEGNVEWKNLTADNTSPNKKSKKLSLVNHLKTYENNINCLKNTVDELYTSVSEISSIEGINEQFDVDDDDILADFEDILENYQHLDVKLDNQNRKLAVILRKVKELISE